ncbi:agmatinase [Arenibacterium sp. LLYu02]|uniref:agmatinase n=1 Tax=Arenibacterium sp. LLYu02 TaxID=3404132 RepID=UPI003B20CEE5
MTWTKEKLAELRAKFEGVDGGTMYDPHFKEIADLIFGADGLRAAPYVGLPTLLDAPSVPVESEGFAALQVALMGVPMDLAVTNRNGSRFGPRALRAIERIGPYNEGLKVAPLHQMAVGDIGDVPFSSRFDLAQSHKEIEAHARKVVAAGILPLSVGGDHSVSLPLLRAVAQDGPVGLLHIDAHCDTGGTFDGERFHHGGPFRHAVLEGLVDPERSIQIGIRGSAEYVWEFSTLSGMTVVPAQEFERRGLAAIIAQTKAVLGQGPVYVTFDIDSLDPAFAPGTGTPEVAGLTPREVREILRSVKGLNIVGGDVVEVAPAYDATSNTAQNGAQVLFEILSLMAFSPALKPRS